MPILNNQEYNNVATVTSSYYTITKEMRKHFYDRTINHRNLFNKYYFDIFQSYPTAAHDTSKFYEPELEFYIAITWNYYCKDNKIPFVVSPELQEKMNEATCHHIKTNPHHPEYWTDRVDNLIDIKDRDKFDANSVEIIDATKMPPEYVVELCCDWCAVAGERGNTPFEWAGKVIGSRWGFDERQIDLIYQTLEYLWE